MRIRSIVPRFYESEDVGRMDWGTRLLFIGLWSYVEDNGVGRDVESLIAANLFPFDLSRDSLETLKRVSEGLKVLSDGGQVIRYEMDGEKLLFVVHWDDYQKVNNPARCRYPRPTRDYVESQESLKRVSVMTHETLTTGDEETSIKNTRSSAAASEPDFDDWWAMYPRKTGKGNARRAYRAAKKKANAEVLLAAVKKFAKKVAADGTDQKFIPMPTTWLNGERWDDEDSPDAAADSWEALKGYSQDAEWAAWSARCREAGVDPAAPDAYELMKEA